MWDVREPERDEWSLETGSVPWHTAGPDSIYCYAPVTVLGFALVIWISIEYPLLEVECFVPCRGVTGLGW